MLKTLSRALFLMLLGAQSLAAWADQPHWIDVRSVGEYESGHVEGAVNIPHTEIAERIAEPLGVDFMQAVWGIHDLINETMAAAAKTHIAEKGGNPGVVTVAAFGGAGPVHAFGLARKLGACRLLVPPNAGVGSALGFFTAPTTEAAMASLGQMPFLSGISLSAPSVPDPAEAPAAER